MSLDELLPFRQWIIRDPKKTPFQVNGLYHAASNDPNQWSTYSEALAALQGKPGWGLGFVLSENDPYTCVDLDTYKFAAGDPGIAEHHNIYKWLNSYSEASPQGGVHIWVKGKVKSRYIKFGEIWSAGHYMTVSFQPANGNNVIHNRQAELDQWIQFLGPEPTPVIEPVVETVEVFTDGEIWTKCVEGANGDKFKELWEGRWKEMKYPSQSEADLALMNIICYHTDDQHRAVRLFRKSILGQRPKAQRNDYSYGLAKKSFDQKFPPIDIPSAIALTNQLKQKIKAQRVQQLEVTSIEPIQPTSVSKNTNWTYPPGVLGDIARFIYDAAYSPLMEVAIGGAIAYYAGLMGRAYNVNGMGLNQYVAIIARTGQGKEAAKLGISKLQNHLTRMLPISCNIEDRIGPEYIASSQGIYKRMERSPCCVSIIPEFGLTLQGLSNKFAKQNEINIRSALLKFYSSSGRSGHIAASAYSDEFKNGKGVKQPAFSLLGESTPSEFYKAVDESSVANGLLPRLTLIEYNGDSPQPNELASNLMPDPQLLMNLSSQLQIIFPKEVMCDPIDIQWTQQAMDFWKHLQNLTRAATDKHNRAGDDHLAEIQTRIVQKVIKLAGLLSIGQQPYQPIITLPDIEWANVCIQHGANILTNRFREGTVGIVNLQTEQLRLIASQLSLYTTAVWSEKFGKNYYITSEQKAANVFHFQYLNANLSQRAAFKNSGNTKQAFEQCLAHMCNTGAIQQIERNDAIRGNRMGLMFRILDLQVGLDI